MITNCHINVIASHLFTVMFSSVTCDGPYAHDHHDTQIHLYSLRVSLSSHISLAGKAVNGEVVNVPHLPLPLLLLPGCSWTSFASSAASQLNIIPEMNSKDLLEREGLSVCPLFLAII